MRPAALQRRRVRRFPRLRARLRIALVAALFIITLLPAAAWLLGTTQPAFLQKHAFKGMREWYGVHVQPVQELRPMATFPAQWEGAWYDSNKNYARFEHWFADNLGLRDLMIRTKNELDYRLFRHSSRVYYGAHHELFGRNLADNELPATERLLASPQQVDAVRSGAQRFAAQLSAQGITMVLVAPIQKQYFKSDRLPYFAPRLAQPSNFLALYDAMLAAPELHMVDVRAILRKGEGQFPIFFHQDFHWTDLVALQVAADATDRIARLEGAAQGWRHPMRFENQPFVGVETRFAARLNANETMLEPQLVKTWTERHTRIERDAKATGIEFETGTLDDPALLPSTCMYGNSFSDGMLRAGLIEHFQKFTKLDRGLPLHAVPALVQGRCKYLIVQVLDIQTDRWNDLASTGQPATTMDAH